jgi:hypothetical protein
MLPVKNLRTPAVRTRVGPPVRVATEDAGNVHGAEVVPRKKRYVKKETS